MNQIRSIRGRQCGFGLILAGLAILFGGVSSAADSAARPNEAPIPVPIAVLFPLTGNMAEQGDWARHGFEIAREEINRAGRVSVELIYEDTRGEPQAAVSAFKQVLARRRIPAVIIWGSGVGMALSPLANTSRTVLMGAFVAAPDYRSEGDYTFRVFPSAALEAEFIAGFMAGKLKAKRIGAAYIDNDYGQGLLKSFRRGIESEGAVLQSELAFNPGETDFRTHLAAMKAREAEAIFLAAYPSEGALFVRQARELGIRCPIVASTAMQSGGNLFALGGNAVDGLLIAVTDLSREHPFFGASQKRSPNTTGFFQTTAARAYDALMVLAGALEGCPQRDGECLRRQLAEMSVYHGATGVLDFDSAGEVNAGFRIFEARDGKLSPRLN